MDFPLHIRSFSSMDCTKPLHVDTNIVYNIDEEKFPGLKDNFFQYEPSLIVSPEYLFDQRWSPDVIPNSKEEVEEDITALLESLDVPLDISNLPSNDLLGILLDDINDVIIAESNEMECRISPVIKPLFTEEGTSEHTQNTIHLAERCRVQKKRRYFSTESCEEVTMTTNPVKRQKHIAKDTLCTDSNPGGINSTQKYSLDNVVFEGTKKCSTFGLNLYHNFSYCPLQTSGFREW